MATDQNSTVSQVDHSSTIEGELVRAAALDVAEIVIARFGTITADLHSGEYDIHVATTALRLPDVPAMATSTPDATSPEWSIAVARAGVKQASISTIQGKFGIRVVFSEGARDHAEVIAEAIIDAGSQIMAQADAS